MKKRTIIIFAVCAAVFAALCVYAFIALNGTNDGLHTAVISVDGREVRRIDLLAAPDETFTVESENGYNIVCVKDGKISVIEASCPDKVCVNHGELASELLPIICLPNKMIIELR